MNKKLILILVVLMLSLNAAFSQKLKNRQKFQATDFVYNLTFSTPNVIGNGGSSRAMNIDTLSSLAGEGVSMAYTVVKPCGLVLPHVHQRATELILVVKGTFQTAFVEENNGRTIINTLTAGQSTFFPQGLIHQEHNIGCEEAIFVSAFSSEDPGALTVSTRMFTLPDESLQATFAEKQPVIDKLREDLPASPAAGTAQCLKKCGLKK